MSHSILEGYYIEILYRESTYTITDSTVLSNKNREAGAVKVAQSRDSDQKWQDKTESQGLRWLNTVSARSAVLCKSQRGFS